ncbi:helix-turn-helix domain-containing protein [Paenibacillus sp. J5C_2022]|uniref:helix-turn-helix domain-containing protein n=1 Tax=Paenibacillus sp. J5C2022 TaxID=2977129 RepID=UPI0021D2D815|nr:RodZ family helix-turn-helix domain-containing protein [Paenibacillus sp. J5C2022]MCU6707171.1 helix-turn-helix domain-containing protein [Paenibacillus sp. J5C2022]
MSELGALLRKAREERGYTLDDIQELTKIRKRYLEAIESGDYRVLPGNFYVRAFVKNYSEAVGLDADEVLRYYQHEVPSVAQAEQSNEPLPARKPQRMKSPASEKLGKVGFNLLMWSFLILIVAVVWYYALNNNTDSPQKVGNEPFTDETDSPQSGGGVTDNATAGEETPTATAEPTPEPSTAPATVTLSGNSGSVDTYDIGPAGIARKVELKLAGRTWLEVYEGSNKSGKRLYYANASKDDVLTYELTGNIYIRTGRADYTEITVNGVIVPDGDNGGTKSLLLRPLTEAIGEE